MDTENKRLTIREKAGYGCGDFASVLYWQTISSYLLFFYTDIFGITAAAAGVMIFFSRMWDGINDPLMGMLADRTETRFGKFRPYLLWLAVPMAVVAVLTFSTPDLSPTGKLVYAWITYFAFMMVYTAINIPYSSLLGVITSDPVERTSVALYKYGFCYVAAGISSLTILPLAENVFATEDKAAGWQYTMILFGMVATVFYFITFLSVKERVKPPKGQKSSIVKDLKDLMQNRYWGILLLVSLFMILCIATRSSASAHYFKYYVGEQQLTLLGETYTFGFVSMTSVFNAMGGWVAILGVISTKWIAKALGKKRAFILLFIVVVVTTAAYFVLDPTQIILIFALHFIGTFCGGPLSPLIWAMYADTADYSEWKKGRRATGLVFSASTMSQKMGWAVGTFVAGLLLSAVGFEPNVEQTADVKDGLKLLMSIIPAAAGVVSIALMMFYKLDEKTMKTIEKELNDRRAASE